MRWTLFLIVSVPLLCLPLLAQASPATSPPSPLLLQPATGYWYDADRPGTGMALQHRGDQLGLVLYHYRMVANVPIRQPDWHLATGTLEDGRLKAPLLHFAGGSCLGCDPFVAASGEDTGILLRLEFASAREATLQIGDAPSRRMVSMPYGVPYESALATPGDLPLPDLRGDWVVQGNGAASRFALSERSVGDQGIVQYRGEEAAGSTQVALECGVSGCAMVFDPATHELTGTWFRIGDISENRMTGADPMTFPVQAFRIQDTGVRP